MKLTDVYFKFKSLVIQIRKVEFIQTSTVLETMVDGAPAALMWTLELAALLWE